MKQITSLILFALVSFLAMAEPPDSPPPSTSTTSSTVSMPQSKLVSSFTPLAGSTENATSLVNGLRSGSTIVLTAPSDTPGAPPDTVTFSPTPRPMGYGNVRIALSLAKYQLASQGITQPTPEQLQTALMGTPTISGTSSSQTGILQMRASGMGWGQIANSMGVKLGAVMSGKYVATTSTVNASGTRSSSGVINAEGTHNSEHSGITTAEGARSQHSGITTAEGAHGSNGNKGMTSVQGNGNSSGGVVNAAGSKAGGIGNATGAGGHGSVGKKS